MTTKGQVLSILLRKMEEIKFTYPTIPAEHRAMDILIELYEEIKLEVEDDDHIKERFY